MSETTVSADSLTTNLPIQPTPFIGREAEVEQVVERLARKEVRLLVLTGPGGTGKTRLGLKVAANVAEEFKDGVFYVPLESIATADLVVKTIAHELGIQDRSERPVGELLTDYLREKQVLLVLDNFEQVLAAASSLANLLATCAGIKILITSREILHLQGEFDFPVPPLSLPDRNTAVNADLDPVPLLLQCEAVRLFTDRAVAAQPAFELSRENAPIVAEICHRLDGLPLAIELAAARIRFLPPQEMLERLDNSLSFLTRGAKDSPSRQQTLRGTIDWSHDLLDEGERKIFSRLSVFAGGFTLEAAEEVCRGDDLDCDALDDIASLEEKSLLKRQDSDGDPRFAMLETVREYAAERLTDGGEAKEVRRRHAEYFYALALKARPELSFLNSMVWRNRLERDHDNIRSALAWSLEGGQVELGIKLTAELVNYWAAEHLNEGRDWYNKAMSADSTPSSSLARVIYCAGYIACELGDTTRGLMLLEQSVAMCRSFPDGDLLAGSLYQCGSWSMMNGDPDRATVFLEEARAVARESEYHKVAANALHSLGVISAGRGDLERAEALIEEGLAQLEGGRSVVAASFMQMTLGGIAIRRGDFERAAALAEQSLLVFRQVGDEYSIATALQHLGGICIKQGNMERANALLEEATPLFREMGIKGRVFDGNQGVSHSLILFADIARTEGRIERAVRLLGGSATIQKPANNWQKFWSEMFDDLIATSRVQLGDKKFEVVWEEGQAMSLEEAVSCALEEAHLRPGDSFPDGLSNREVQVAVLLVEGLTNREIGKRLYISERTVANHVQSVLNKTGSGNRAEAAAYVIRNGLTT